MLQRMLRAAAASAVATCVLVCGAWLGGACGPEAQAARAAPPRATDGQAAYPSRTGAGELALGDALAVNGQPMQLSLFFTADPPAQVIAWYGAALRKKGLLPIARAEAQAAHVSVFDPEDGLQRSVTALPQAGGQTLVLVSVTNPRRPPRLLTGADRASFPVPAEHRAFLSFDSEDAGARAQSAHFVTSLSSAAVLSWYRAALTAQGFAEQSADTTSGLASFVKGPVSLAVAVQALDARAGAVVFVNRVEGGAR